MMKPLAKETRMLQIRSSGERGIANHGWLQSKHTFSFADYYDPSHMGFRSLRVINEDRIQGGTGFGSHPHRDMEIISYVVSGALQHKDSMGNSTSILPGEVQRLSAGTGVVHSEYNQLSDQETHFFQIWIMPKSRGGAPGYGQKSFETELASQKLVLTVSQEGRDGSIAINQDADLYISRLKKGEMFEFAVRAERGVWIQVVKGSFDVKFGESRHTQIKSGDGLGIEEPEADGAKPKETLLKVTAQDAGELLLFDLA